MIFGMTPLTFVHVVLSIIGIASGLVVARAMMAGPQPDRWTTVFLLSTVATSITGFMFPFHRLLPSHVVGVLSLLVLVPALYAYYGASLTGPWRRIYAITAVSALYLNVFVLVAQLFQKVPALRQMAPTQSEPPFAIVQLVVLAAFIWLGLRAVRGYRLQGSPG